MMGDIQELIRKIVTDRKIAESSNFADKVYRDKPILFTAPQMAKYTPPEIGQMRDIGKNSPHDSQVFYKQAKFMESFEDSFDYRCKFVHYYPTYRVMTNEQLRGYFSWRTRIKRGEIVCTTSLSFVFVYIYELLNGIGAASDLDGFYTLKNFWSAYRELDFRIDRYVPLWLKDYVIYHNLDASLLDGLPDAVFDHSLSVLVDYRSRSVDEVFAALNAVSAYKLDQSKFYRQHPDEVKQAAYRVFAAIYEHYNRNPKKTAVEQLFGKVATRPYFMFHKAVFHFRKKQASREYRIGASQKYMCESDRYNSSCGSWDCQRFHLFGLHNKKIGGILKTVDFVMRQNAGHKSSLKCGKINKTLRSGIEKAIALYEEEKRANTPVHIEIDTSRLHAIRAAATSIQSKLLVEDMAGEELVPASPARNAAHPSGLTAPECELIHCLLSGRSYAPLLKTHGLMLSVVMDSINEKLYDRFSDTVLVDDNDTPVIVDDYAEEMQRIFAQ